MAAAENTNKDEKRCRKKIATLLSLMDFHDDDPETTIIIMRQKLKEIQEKEAIANSANNNKKLSTNIKKITFKSGLETLLQETNFPVIAVPKKKRSSIQRLPNSKFHTSAAVAHHHDSKMITIYDDSAHQDKLFKKIEKDHDNVCSSSSVIINDDDHHDDGGVMMMMIKKMEIDHVSRNPSSDHMMIIDNEDDDDSGSNGGVMDLRFYRPYGSLGRLENQRRKRESQKKKSMARRQISSTQKKVPVNKVVATALVSNEVTERLKVFIADDMKGSDMKLVIQKSLFNSDLEKGQNRLNIPIKQLKTDDFLTDDQKEFLGSNKDNEIMVRVLGPRFRMYEKTMGFKIWNMNTTQNYVLKGNWSNFVNDYKDDLKVNTLIQVWSFRKDQQLCFAIICVD